MRYYKKPKKYTEIRRRDPTAFEGNLQQMQCLEGVLQVQGVP